MSESNPPLEIVGMLNDYLEVMTLVIQEHGGVIDKFIGDAIMAVFYPDDSGRSDEERALVASLDMRDALQKFNKKRVEEGKFEIDNGIGLNTGNVIKGSIGSRKHRVDLTVIGDNVNVAARLESLSKEGKYTKIIISEETLNQVRELIVVEPLEIQNVKGKIRTVKMYEVVRRI
jgi:adenylate cyclase